MLPKNIEGFIKEHHVMTLATISNDTPYCSNLFYGFIASRGELIFTTSLSTEHGKNMMSNSNVGGSIVLETKVIGKIRGIQLRGKATLVDSENISAARVAYLKRFPYAIFADLELWSFKITYAKLTDNRLGFGKKEIWNSGESDGGDKE